MREPSLSFTVDGVAGFAHALAQAGIAARQLAVGLAQAARDIEAQRQRLAPLLLGLLPGAVERANGEAPCLLPSHAPQAASMPGHLCEACMDAPTVALQPAPWGGEMGVCRACRRAPTSPA